MAVLNNVHTHEQIFFFFFDCNTSAISVTCVRAKIYTYYLIQSTKKQSRGHFVYTAAAYSADDRVLILFSITYWIYREHSKNFQLIYCRLSFLSLLLFLSVCLSFSLSRSVWELWSFALKQYVLPSNDLFVSVHNVHKNVSVKWHWLR